MLIQLGPSWQICSGSVQSIRIYQLLLFVSHSIYIAGTKSSRKMQPNIKKRRTSEFDTKFFHMLTHWKITACLSCNFERPKLIHFHRPQTMLNWGNEANFANCWFTMCDTLTVINIIVVTWSSLNIPWTYFDPGSQQNQQPACLSIGATY